VDTWVSDISRWVGAVVLVLGLSWNLKDIIIDPAVGHRRVAHVIGLVRIPAVGQSDRHRRRVSGRLTHISRRPATADVAN